MHQASEMPVSRAAPVSPQENLEKLREELLRVKARESRLKAEFLRKLDARDNSAQALAQCQEELKNALGELSAARQELTREREARRSEVERLGAETASADARIEELEHQLEKMCAEAEQKRRCPLNEQIDPAGTCSQLADLFEFLHSLENWQIQLLADNGFSPDDPAVFFCRAGSPDGIKSIWEAMRFHIVNNGQAHHAFALLGVLLRYFAAGNGRGVLRPFTPDIREFDREAAKSWWVTPWRENWHLEPEPIKHTLLPGLQNARDLIIVEPLLALNT